MGNELATQAGSGLSRKAPLTPQESLQKGLLIASALAKLAIRRQAPKMGKADFDVYVEDLFAYDISEIEAACLALGRVERAEGETAFPASATIIKTINSGYAAARKAAQESAALDEIKAREKHMAEHPEEYEYFDWDAAMERINAKAAGQPPRPRPEQVKAPESTEPTGHVFVLTDEMIARNREQRRILGVSDADVARIKETMGGKMGDDLAVDTPVADSV